MPVALAVDEILESELGEGILDCVMVIDSIVVSFVRGAGRSVKYILYLCTVVSVSHTQHSALHLPSILPSFIIHQFMNAGSYAAVSLQAPECY